METAEQLLEKLNRQFNAGEPAAIILRTLTALETAIRQSPPLPRPAVEQLPPVTAAPVILPGMSISVDLIEETDELPIVQVLEVDEAEIEEELRALREAAELRQTRQQHLRPDLTDFHDAEVFSPDEGIKAQPPTGYQNEPLQPAESIPNAPASPAAEVNTEKSGRELNDAIAEQSSSLNDRFRKTVQGQDQPKFLTPITDLRTSIGINDRFRFVNDLFSGDGNGFLQAIQYLNHCDSYADACKWLESHLTASGKWDPEHPALRDFLHLLERRFA